MTPSAAVAMDPVAVGLGQLLGPVAVLALAALGVAFTALIVGLVLERRERGHWQRSTQVAPTRPAPARRAA